MKVTVNYHYRQIRNKKQTNEIKQRKITIISKRGVTKKEKQH